MTILLPYRIRRGFIQSHPEWIFLYGSDYLGKSFFGQAYEAHGEPNAYPIPTMWKICPSSGEKFFNDGNYNFFKSLIDEKIAEIPSDKIILPFPRMGMGHSRMYELAPKLFEYLTCILDYVKHPEIKIDYQGRIYPIYST